MIAESNTSLSRCVLIPAAGFGNRVLHGGSKELLPRPLTSKPLIDQAIADALSSGAKPHVILRSEKTELISYLLKFAPEVSIQEITKSRDWPETILFSSAHWLDYNLIYLPDLEFRPRAAVLQIFHLLEHQGCDVVIAGRQKIEPSQWGVFDRFTKSNKIRFCEKPQGLKSAWAWGLIGFRSDVGVSLLTELLTSSHDHKWRELSLNATYIELDELNDLTR
jgi:hypothetical protein